MNTYAAYYDNEIREASSSGGIFSLLAQQFDVVYGVAMTEDCYEAKFIRTAQDISSMRGSKYLQAKMGDILKKVREDLLSDKTVLFTGTTCQINGLKKFLGKEYPTLWCVDVICHGVPSPVLWKKYIMYQESQYGKKVKSVNFRCKEYGWKPFGIKENEVFISKDKDSYMQMFLRDYCLRPSCYACQAKYNKMSDMTIADFWGIEDVATELDDGKGTSLIIVRTQKGKDIFEKICNNLKFKEVTYEDGVRKNPSEYSSVKRPVLRDTFFEDMNKMSFEELSKKYAQSYKPSLKQRVKHKIKTILLGSKNKVGGVNYGILFTFCCEEQSDEAGKKE